MRWMWSIPCAALALSLVSQPADAQGCGNSTGKTPLIDLPPNLYQGFPGGLYPGEQNVPPAAHLAAALIQGSRIRPLDGNGDPNTGCGAIGILSFGMSNATHEFAPFERQEDLNVARNSRVVLINGALGGQAASIIADPNAPYWDIVRGRVAAMGMTPAQVQVGWLKEANAGPPDNFPVHAQMLQADLTAIVQNLRDIFPNMALCYLSCRTYGGYSVGPLNPEPQAYESGFSVKWLIEDQINGNPSLNFDPGVGPVESPLLLWGPYLWADGQIPSSAGLVWCRSDFESDGVHPAPSGEQKVADLLSSFFTSEVTTQAWYPTAGSDPVIAFDAVADAHVVSTSPDTNFGAETELVTAASGPTETTVYLRFDMSTVSRPVLLAKLDLRISTTTQSPERAVRLVSDTTWNELGITFNNAPAISDDFLQIMPQASRDGSIAADVTTAVNEDDDGILSFALMVSAGSGNMLSRESGQPPRVVLVTDPALVTAYCSGKTTSQGCVPFMSSAGGGPPSTTDTNPFNVRGNDFTPGNSGVLIYGFKKFSLNFHGGKLCVKTPTRTAGKAAKSKSPVQCIGPLTVGRLTTNFNLRIQGSFDPMLTAGQKVFTQWQQRDSANTIGGFGDALANGLNFFICP